MVSLSPLLLGMGSTTEGAAIISSSSRCSGNIGGIRVIPSSSADCGGEEGDGEVVKEEEVEEIVEEADDVVFGSVVDVYVAVSAINGTADKEASFFSSFLLKLLMVADLPFFSYLEDFKI